MTANLKRFTNSWNYYYFTDPPIHATGITLNKSILTLTEAGQAEQLIATITPSDAVDKSVTWSSSDTTVAIVAQDWTVTCITPWSCTITCTTNDWWYTVSCSVTANIQAFDFLLVWWWWAWWWGIYSYEYASWWWWAWWIVECICYDTLWDTSFNVVVWTWWASRNCHWCNWWDSSLNNIIAYWWWGWWSEQWWNSGSNWWSWWWWVAWASSSWEWWTGCDWQWNSWWRWQSWYNNGKWWGWWWGWYCTAWCAWWQRSWSWMYWWDWWLWYDNCFWWIEAHYSYWWWWGWYCAPWSWNSYWWNWWDASTVDCNWRNAVSYWSWWWWAWYAWWCKAGKWWAWCQWIAIIRYPSDWSYLINSATGWTITTCTIDWIEYKIHTFTSDWTFCIVC